MYIETLPTALEDPAALIARRKAAETRKNLWRSTLTNCYRFAMPARETFSWSVEGQPREVVLYDSTLQELTHTAANTMCANLFPGWKRWVELSPGGAIPKDDIPDDILTGIQKATATFFDYLNASNFGTVIGEVALDLLVGTGALDFDEGSAEEPFLFTALPLPAIEFEEGPNGKAETTFMLRKPCARNLVRMYPGMKQENLSEKIRKKIEEKPDETVEVIQAKVYDPESKKYFGVVVDVEGSQIIWRYDYGQSCPTIVARASKVAGETYGRGRVMRALADAMTLDKMQEFVLRHAALQIAPPMTGVSDGVMNPYTATLAPNTILPVATNDSGNPSLKVLDFGGNFAIGEQLMEKLRERVRRTMLGPEPGDGPVKSATEVSVNDRNYLWVMNGEYGRIQVELLAPIVVRGVFILQKKGLMPKFKVDGREVTLTFTSPFAKSQNVEDVLGLQNTLGTLAALGPEVIQIGLKTEDMPKWVAMKNGLDHSLVRTKDEQDELKKQVQGVVNTVQQANAQQQEGGPDVAQPGQ